MTDAAGRKVTVEYRPDLGFVSKVTLPDGRFTRYDYEGGRLQSFTSAITQTMAVPVRAQGRLERVINARGLAEVTNTYNATTGRVEKQQRHQRQGRSRSSGTPPRRRPRSPTRTGSSTTTGTPATCSSTPRTATATPPASGTTTQANPSLNVDGNNNQREATYDGAGNMATHKAPEPFSFTEKATFTPRATSRSRIIDGNGIEWKAEYNDFHEMTKRTDGKRQLLRVHLRQPRPAQDDDGPA